MTSLTRTERESATYGHPRPWVARQMSDRAAWEVVSRSKAGGPELADVVANYLSEKDAQIIAAAPDLLREHRRDLDALDVIERALGLGHLPEHKTALILLQDMRGAKLAALEKVTTP